MISTIQPQLRSSKNKPHFQFFCFAVLPECRFYIPTPVQRRCFAIRLSLRRSSQSHIPFRRSFSFRGAEEIRQNDIPSIVLNKQGSFGGCFQNILLLVSIEKARLVIAFLKSLHSFGQRSEFAHPNFQKNLSFLALHLFPLGNTVWQP